MAFGYDRPSYVLPFDHRATSSKTTFGWSGTLYLEPTGEIAAMEELVHDTFKAAVAGGIPRATHRVLSRAIRGPWEIVNSLTRLRPSRRLAYRVTDFGSARPSAPPDSSEDFPIPICRRTGLEIIDVLRKHHGRWEANLEATA